MKRFNSAKTLKTAISHIEKRGVLVLEFNSTIKGYSIHNFNRKIKGFIVLKKDNQLNMLLVFAHEIGHLFAITDNFVLKWRPDDREHVANYRAMKLLSFLEPSLVSKFKAHYRKSLKEKK